MPCLSPSWGQNIKLPDQRDKKWLVHCVVKPPVRQACSGRPCCSVIMLQTACSTWCRDDWESRQETSGESESGDCTDISKQWMTETCEERISPWSVCKECSWSSNLTPKLCCTSWQIGHKGYFVNYTQKRAGIADIHCLFYLYLWPIDIMASDHRRYHYSLKPISPVNHGRYRF